MCIRDRFQSDAEIQNYKNDRGELLQPNAKPGDIRFKDLNGDGVINSDDRDFKGNPLPDCSMGLTLGFNYKNFDVSAFFQGVFGNEVYNLTNYLGEFYNQAQYNKNSTILDAWQMCIRDRVETVVLGSCDEIIARGSSYYDAFTIFPDGGKNFLYDIFSRFPVRDKTFGTVSYTHLLRYFLIFGE